MKPWVSLGQDDEAFSSVGKEQKKRGAELKGGPWRDPAHPDLSPREASISWGRDQCYK